jgi:hypothetical protein
MFKKVSRGAWDAEGDSGVRDFTSFISVLVVAVMIGVPILGVLWSWAGIVGGKQGWWPFDAEMLTDSLNGLIQIADISLDITVGSV